MENVSSKGQDWPRARRDLSSDENPDSKRLMLHPIHKLATKQSKFKKGREGLNVPPRRSERGYFTSMLMKYLNFHKSPFFAKQVTSEGFEHSASQDRPLA